MYSRLIRIVHKCEICKTLYTSAKLLKNIVYYFVFKLNYLFVHNHRQRAIILGAIVPRVTLKLYFSTEISQKLCMCELKTRCLPVVETLFYFC